MIFEILDKTGRKNRLTKEQWSHIRKTHPEVENYGDYSTNLALILAGRLKIRPMEVAEKIGNILLRPSKFFSQLEKETNINKPFAYYLILQIFYTILTTAILLIFFTRISNIDL